MAPPQIRRTPPPKRKTRGGRPAKGTKRKAADADLDEDGAAKKNALAKTHLQAMKKKNASVTTKAVARTNPANGPMAAAFVTRKVALVGNNLTFLSELVLTLMPLGRVRCQ